MFGLPLAFGAPAVLSALVALPVIWWLLRLTPPKPRTEVFPPVRILARVLKKEETPSRSPWWLTALRLLMAALVIIALADPILNPRDNVVSGDGPLTMVVDNGWTSAPDWQARVDTAHALIDDAEENNVPISLVFTAEPTANATPGPASLARDRLEATGPRPLFPDRAIAAQALVSAFASSRPGTLALLTDGIATPEAENALEQIAGLSPDTVHVIEGARDEIVAITDADNGPDGFTVSLTRVEDPQAAARSVAITALDIRGRPIASATVPFAPGEANATGVIDAPFELRNDFARIRVDGTGSAGATFLLDDSFRRRRVALLSGEAFDLSQPLLSPLYYISRALQPYADLLEPADPDLARAIPELLEQRPSVLVMADIGTLPEDLYQPVQTWIENGGTLLRFAGPRLAGAASDDPLVPVRLRRGERALGGSLSWTEPQPLAGFSPNSPFAGMETPDGVTVSRQVLAEPSPDLATRTWASLADGTPLVTSRAIGDGRIILFHVTAEATWSNLPISGDFVEMLRRTIVLSRAGGVSANERAQGQTLPPYRLLNANGVLVPASGEARPVEVTGGLLPPASFDNPPGLYGSEDGFRALNILRAGYRLMPLDVPDLSVPVTRASFEPAADQSLKPVLLVMALVLLLVDTLIILFMAGALQRAHALRSRVSAVPSSPGASASLSAIAVLGLAWALFASPAGAADEQPGDIEVLDKLDATHIAYVLTGDVEVDRISERGLKGLSLYLTYRTALEPGDPVGVDIGSDHLSFYPILYWPISANAPMPSSAAISRVDNFMKSGGTVLFDTRDQLSGFGTGATSAETMRLRAILADLDIPQLEPVPPDHVLTKAFYLLDEFPGRYRGSELWVEALADADSQDTARPARAGDGVSSIIITGNDFAGAWAIDDLGVALFPTIPADPMQREFAYRAGVNIMMYMLTGNYKADQVHIPALLERLGQ